jgi:hypothetical protein
VVEIERHLFLGIRQLHCLLACPRPSLVKALLLWSEFLLFRCSLSSLLNKPVLLVNLQGLYPDRHIDVEVSSGDDHVSKIDASTAELRAPAGDEPEGEGIYSTEPITPGPIRSNTSVQADPSVADRVISSIPSADG